MLAVSESVQLAVIVAMGTAVSPLIVGWVVTRQAKMAKRLDWDRQDEVAARVAEVVAAADAASASADQHAKQINGKLDGIHTLVNSEKTAGMEEMLDSRRSRLVLMKEVLDLKRAAGREPSSEALADIARLETSVTQLRQVLKDRLAATIVADAQVSGSGS